MDMASGEVVWQVERDAISWASPVLIDSRGRQQLVLARSVAIDGYDPTSGELLWYVECLDAEVASSPGFADGIAFVGNDMSVGSALDVRGYDSEPTIRWQWDDALPDAASPVANSRYLIVPTALGVISCLELETGKMLWEQEFDHGFTSSPILAGDCVYLCDLSGKMWVFRMGGEFELLGSFKVGEPV